MELTDSNQNDDKHGFRSLRQRKIIEIWFLLSLISQPVDELINHSKRESVSLLLKLLRANLALKLDFYLRSSVDFQSQIELIQTVPESSINKFY